VKTCSKCGRNQALAEFQRRRDSSDGRRSHCKSCSKARYAALRSPLAQFDVSARPGSLRARRHWLATYLLCHPCVDCGLRDIRVLEFDHRVDEVKSDSVSRLFLSGRSWEVVLAEIAKCEVRCVNCHRRRTSARAGHWREAHRGAADAPALAFDSAYPSSICVGDRA
jgi:hypothetical protein